MQEPERDASINNQIRRELGMNEQHDQPANGAGIDLGTGESLEANNTYFDMLEEDWWEKHRLGEV